MCHIYITTGREKMSRTYLVTLCDGAVLLTLPCFVPGEQHEAETPKYRHSVCTSARRPVK